MNTFAIKIAKRAGKVDFENLSPEEQKNLFDNRKFDASKDEIYSFKVAVVISTGKVKKQNALKRDFKRADTMLVEIRDFTGFTLTGIHPLSEEYDRTTTRETGVEGEVGAGIKLFSASLKPVGRTKEEIKLTRTSILQSFDETYAQWVFLKPYLENHLEYNFHIAAQKLESGAEAPSFICEVDVQEKNRSLLPNTAHKRVACVDKL
jgi:hypothetical protein